MTNSAEYVPRKQQSGEKQRQNEISHEWSDVHGKRDAMWRRNAATAQETRLWPKAPRGHKDPSEVAGVLGSILRGPQRRRGHSLASHSARAQARRSNATGPGGSYGSAKRCANRGESLGWAVG